MIEICGVTKQYDSHVAVKDISFTVEKGEILGFLGPNGAGKSTTMNIITGYFPATSGQVKVCGFDVAEEPLEVKKRIGYLPEHPPLYPEMTVEEYLRFVAELKLVPKEERNGQIDYVVDVVKLEEVRKRVIKNLSKGYQQRVGLAQALLGKPEVLILDEPTVGLDPNQIIEIRQLIKKLGEEHTIILSSHILPEVNAVCSRIVIINRGKIVAIDTPENLANGLSENSFLQVRVEGELDKVLGVINGLEGLKAVTVVENNDSNSKKSLYSVEVSNGEEFSKILSLALAKEGLPILELNVKKMTLEDVFLSLTGKGAQSWDSEQLTTGEESVVDEPGSDLQDGEQKESATQETKDQVQPDSKPTNPGGSSPTEDDQSKGDDMVSQTEQSQKEKGGE